MSESYIQLAKSEFWGAGHQIFVYYKASWLILSCSQSGEPLFQGSMSLRWRGEKKSYLIRESKHQGLSHHPSTEGPQKKWGGLTWSGKIKGTFPEEVTFELDLEEWAGIFLLEKKEEREKEVTEMCHKECVPKKEE